ncbi:MAG: 7-cyano-7-deazaguanine synthase [Phycisphaerae bacterium]
MKNNSKPKVCTRCVLPETFPGIRFDADGVCSMCRDAGSAESVDERREALRLRMEAAITERRGRGPYDCVVAFSGGKDSTYTLALLVNEYELNCLAVTVDNGFISRQAVKNCRTVTDRLGVDFMLFKPAPEFMNRMYRASATEAGIHAPAAIRRASSVCNSCIQLINTYMVKVALQNDVPIIAGGYIGGQVPGDAALIDLDPIAQARMGEQSLIRYTTHFGADAAKHMAVHEPLLQRTAGQTIAVINPLLTRAVTEAELLDSIGKIGWEPAKDTGRNSSNCMLNDLGIAIHHKRHGFHPYALEISEQVRSGLMSRDEALAKVADLPESADVAWQARKIGLPADVLV